MNSCLRGLVAIEGIPYLSFPRADLRIDLDEFWLSLPMKLTDLLGEPPVLKVLFLLRSLPLWWFSWPLDLSSSMDEFLL